MAHSKPLTAVVVGAGWAADLHTQALQHAGVAVAAICARNPEVVQSVAARLGVPRASTDWKSSLRELRPDIVTLATPANLPAEVVEQAVQLGCHVICEKPLAATAEEAQRMLALVEQAGVKHAYAATQRYEPGIAWAAELISSGRLGTLRAIEMVFCGPFSNDLEPWGWGDLLAEGGGVMNAGMTHILAMLERVVGGTISAAAGEAWVFRPKAPVVPITLSNSLKQAGTVLTAEQAATLEWRPRDADDAFSVLLQITPQSSQQRAPISVLLNANVCAATAAPNNGWYFRGSEADLIGEGLFTLALTQQRGEEREALPTPQRLIDVLPQLGDDTANKWAVLARDFVADLRSELHEPYLTFRDGWRYQTIIDAIRHGQGWYRIA